MHGQNNGVSLRKCYTGVTTGFSSQVIMKNVRAGPFLEL